ncbi:MAG: purine-binding chemotaxis protein CheW [Thermoplasmata archaeon]|nr:purine-binding chemotaxis protein CheW [Thermoplasmata archaeon]
MNAEESEQELQLVSFRICKETFAIPVSQIREIERMEDITHVPKMPDYIEGVINLRGQITTVIDLKRRFGLGTSEHSSQTRIIVAEIEDTQLGIIVDAVHDVIRVSQNMVSPIPKTISTNIDTRYLTGICKLPNNLVMLVDVSKILTEKELAQVTNKENNTGTKQNNEEAKK